MNLNQQSKPCAALWVLCLCLLFVSTPGLAEIVLPDSEAQPIDGTSSVPARRSGELRQETPEYHEPMNQATHALAESFSSVLPSKHDDMMHSWHMGEVLAGVLIPVLAISLIFGGPVVLVIVLAILHYRARARRERVQSENIARLIEAGRDVPAELLFGDEPAGVKGEDNLRKGVKNIGIGTGLLIFLTLLIDIGIGAVGFILIGLGVSQLVVWKLTDRKVAQPTSQD